MKWIALVMSMLFVSMLSLTAFGLTVPKTVSIKVDFALEQPCETGEIDQFSLRNVWTTAASNHNWSTIQDSVEKYKARFVLLSKIEKVEADTVTMKFLVLDTDTNSTKVLTPEMSVHYGQKSKMVMNEFDKKLQLTVVATRGDGFSKLTHTKH